MSTIAFYVTSKHLLKVIKTFFYSAYLHMLWCGAWRQCLALRLPRGRFLLTCSCYWTLVLWPWSFRFSWLSVRSLTLLVLASLRELHEWPLTCYQLNGLILPFMSFFYLNVSFHQHSIVCPLSGNILHKLVAT